MTRCVDCTAEGITTVRPIASGSRKPRCASHTRTAKKRAQINAHARTVQTTYGLSGEAYWRLYELQGGVCAICRKATGKTKRLAVDHDHETGVVNGLLCGPCNQLRGRYDNAALTRAIAYNLDPPAPRLIGTVIALTGPYVPTKEAP